MIKLSKIYINPNLSLLSSIHTVFTHVFEKNVLGILSLNIDYLKNLIKYYDDAADQCKQKLLFPHPFRKRPII